MRRYQSSTDYPILLAAVRATNELYITPVVQALSKAGINAFGYAVSREQWATEFDRDIGRAWRECGLRNS